MNNTLRYALTMVFAGASLPMVFGQSASEPELKSEEHAEAVEASHSAEASEVQSTEPAAHATEEDQSANSPSFPDSPQNHWAFEALGNLKKHGVLQGYPDGFFRGSRVPTRYEMAYAVNAAYTKLMGLHDGLQGQVKALEDAINGGGNVGADLKSLRDQLTAVQGSLDAIKTHGDDLANLKKLADTFEDDLSKMGVDVQALKKDLSTLEARVTKLEKRRHTIDFRGDANVVAIAGLSKKDSAPGFIDGRLVGTRKNLGKGSDTGLYHEVGLTMTSTNETGPVFRGTLVAGNFLSNPDIDYTGFGNQSRGALLSGYKEQRPEVYLQDLSVKFDTYNLGGVRVDSEFGRFGYQASEHLFKRERGNCCLNPSPRWTNGNHMPDGALLKLNFGQEGKSGSLELVAGKNSSSRESDSRGESLSGLGISPIDFATHPMNGFGFINKATLLGSLTPDTLQAMVDGINLETSNSFTAPNYLKINAADLQATHTYGGHLNVPFGKMGEVNLTGMLFQTNRASIGTHAANRIMIMGGDINIYPKDGIVIKAAYGKTPLMDGKNKTLNEENDYMSGQIGFKTERFGITGGYRQIKENYIAPGSWNEGSLFANATGLKGFIGEAWFKASPTISLNAYGRLESEYKEMVLDATKVRPKYTTVGGQVKFALSEQINLCGNAEYVQVDQKITNLKKATLTSVTGKVEYRMGSARFSAGAQYANHKNLASNYPALALAGGITDKSVGTQLFATATYNF